MENVDRKSEVMSLSIEKALERTCNKLVERGVSKNDLENYSEDAGYGGIPGTFGYKVGGFVRGVPTLILGAIGVYIGHKIHSPSIFPKFPEIMGGLVGLYLGLNTLVCENGDSIPLITSLIKNHPDKLRKIYQEDGFSNEEIDKIFSYDRVQALQDITYGVE